MAEPGGLAQEPPVDTLTQLLGPRQGGGPSATPINPMSPAARMQRGEQRQYAKPVQISNAAEYEALEPGTHFVDPGGQERTKPYVVREADDYDLVPEGADFIDPKGEARTKPRFERLDVTSQTLYDMALTDNERKKILERGYGADSVKQDPRTGEYYVQKDDKFYKSKPGLELLAAGAVPTGGAIAGGILGGSIGSVEPGGGTIAGGVGGAVAGGALGQGFNDMILQLAGVYDRTPGEEVKNIALSGTFAGAGEGAGRTLGALGPGAFAKARAALPATVAKFVGARLPETQTARELAEKGVMVPPSAHMFEAPHIHNLVEVFDPAFHTEQPLMESAGAHYEREGKRILERPEIGATREGSLADPKAKISSERAGVTLLNRAREESLAADTRLKQELEIKKAETVVGAAAKAGESKATRGALEQAQTEARDAAQRMIDAGFSDIQQDVNNAVKVSESGQNSGELWFRVGEKLRAVRQGIMTRARKMYGEADQLAGDHRPNIAGLPERAEDLMAQLPPGFEPKYPDVVRRIRDLAGEMGEDGQWIREPVQPTFGQLHELRSLLRSNVNWYDLTPGMRDGVFKLFSGRVDEILHDVNAVPALRDAARSLDQADAFYRENMRPLTDRNIQAVVSGLESGMPADPKMLYNVLVKEGRSDLIRHVEKLVGQNLWAGVKAADVQEMLDASRSLIPGQIDGRKFVQEVLSRHRSGMLEAVHGPQVTAKLLRQAQNVAALDGKLDLAVLPRDTMTEVIERAQRTAEVAKAAADTDPIGTLAKEMKRITAEHNRELARLKATRNRSPLGFLYDETTGAAEAVNKIIGNEDLLIAAAAKFGENSEEFSLLRQVYAQRVLEGTMRPSENLAKMSPEIQKLIFPGTTLEQMQTLAKEMDFLLNTRSGMRGTAQGMAAMSRVEHPITGKLGEVFDPFKFIPGSNAGARAVLGAYYAMWRKAMTSPAFLRFLEKGLTGNAQEKQAAREIMQRMMRRGAVVGSAVGEQTYQTPNDSGIPPEPSVQNARQAQDGNFYVPDPNRPGKYLQVVQ